MTKSPTVPIHRVRQRGAVLAFAGVMLMMFMTFVVVGVDVGRLAFTASEVQSVADAAAIAAMSSASRMQGGDAAEGTDPVARATQVVNQNYVDATNTDVGSGQVVNPIEPGDWDADNDPPFTPNGGNWDLAKAARATATATVNNFFASLIGAPQSTVRREAVAAASGLCEAQPVMPIALGQCFFDQFQTSGDCTDIPRFFQVPATGNTCFTSLNSDPANGPNAYQYLPTACQGSGNQQGGGVPGPMVSVGDQINVINGQVDVLLKIIEGCFNAGLRDFIIPIVECGNCNQSAEVTGFAAIHLTNVIPEGNPRSRGIYLDAVCKLDPGGQGGCTSSGVTGLALVQ